MGNKRGILCVESSELYAIIILKRCGRELDQCEHKLIDMVLARFIELN